MMARKKYGEVSLPVSDIVYHNVFTYSENTNSGSNTGP